MVGLLVAGGRRRHVGEHDIGAAAERLRSSSGASSSRKSFLSRIDARQLVHVEIVDGDDVRVRIGRLHPLDRHLRPASRRGAEIDHPHARREHADSVSSISISL